MLINCIWNRVFFFFLHLISVFIPLHCDRTELHWLERFWSWGRLQNCQMVKSLLRISSSSRPWNRLYVMPVKQILTMLDATQSIAKKDETWRLQKTPQGTHYWCRWCQAPLRGWSLFFGTGSLWHNLWGQPPRTARACHERHNITVFLWQSTSILSSVFVKSTIEQTYLEHVCVLF